MEPARWVFLLPRPLPLGRARSSLAITVSRHGRLGKTGDAGTARPGVLCLCPGEDGPQSPHREDPRWISAAWRREQIDGHKEK